MRDIKKIKEGATKRDEKRNKEVPKVVTIGEQRIVESPSKLLPVPPTASKTPSKEDVYKAADAIIEEASAKARQIMSHALRDGDAARELKERLTIQLTEAEEMNKKAVLGHNEVVDKKIDLDNREQEIKAAEIKVGSLKQFNEQALQNSTDMMRELGAVMLIAIQKVKSISELDKTGQDHFTQVLDGLASYMRKLNDKDAFLLAKEEKLNTEAVILRDRRTALRNAEHEINRKK